MYTVFTFAQINNGVVERVFDIGIHPAEKNPQAIAIEKANAHGNVVIIKPGDDVVPGDLYNGKKFTRPEPEPIPEPVPEPETGLEKNEDGDK